MTHHPPHTLGTWYRAALLSFTAVAAVDWALASASSTGVSPWGLFTGWLTFTSLWALIATAWALITAALFWAATGHATATPILAYLHDKLRRLWRERHLPEDAPRLATLLAIATALAIFAASSVAISAHLIATRNGPLLISAISFIVQLLLAILAIFTGLILRRLLLRFFRRKPPLINTPNALAIFAFAAFLTAAIALINHQQLFHALEGPSITLLMAATLLHPLVAYLLSQRHRQPAPLLRRSLWLVPFIALLLTLFAVQQPQARRLLVLHGNTAHFVFNLLQRHTAFDNLFNRAGCDPFADDTDACFDPALHRPTSRSVPPDFERPELDRPPNFLFITWDSVRVDRLSFMGHHRDTTPNLAHFADKSLVFDRAFTADSGTGPSFWSFMAGKTPFQVQLHDAHRFPPRIDDSEAMLPELFTEAGYQTRAAVCGRIFVKPRWEGIRRGFDHFENVCGDEDSNLAMHTTAAALQALQELTADDEPFFLWVHYFDPHYPYTDHPHIDFGERRVDRYDEELRYTDEHLAPLIDTALNVDAPLYTVFAADHGENFNEHGRDPHARNLYRIVTQVPLLLHGPGINPARVKAPVAFNDLYPTFLELAELPIPPATTMISQVPVLFGAAPDTTRMVFQENSYSRPRRHTKAVVYDRFHYIMDLTSRTEELYDYVDDPLERNNLIGTGLLEEAILRQAMLRFLETTTIPKGLDN